MAGEELLDLLREGELHIAHAAIAQHHNEERELTAGLAHRHRGVFAPIDLGALAGGKR